VTLFDDAPPPHPAALTPRTNKATATSRVRFLSPMRLTTSLAITRCADPGEAAKEVR